MLCSASPWKALGKKGEFIIVTREFPAVHLCGLETSEWWQVCLDERALGWVEERG